MIRYYNLLLHLNDRQWPADCAPHRRKLRWPKFTPKQTLSKRKIAAIEMIDTKIAEIEIAKFFRSSTLAFSHLRIFYLPPTNLFGRFFEYVSYIEIYNQRKNRYHRISAICISAKCILTDETYYIVISCYIIFWTINVNNKCSQLFETTIK